jgi:chemotaxis protein methyltransferase CheR
MLQISDKDFRQLVTFVKAKYGLNLADKKFLVESRLNNYILDCGFNDFSDYLSVVYIDTSGRELANLINKLTTNHTYFMREPEHFSHFMNTFLPRAEKSVTDRDLRIWSAGCSFGHEPYNLAMCLDEYFGISKNMWNLQILATDISFNALRSAAKGVYAEQALQNVPDKWIDKYFVKLNNGLYQVSSSIRRNVIFKYHNLMDDISFKKKFDLIACRNVMIYFDDATKSSLCKRFYNATEEGGTLYIGHAESAPEDIPYEKETTAIYRKTEVSL